MLVSQRKVAQCSTVPIYKYFKISRNANRMQSVSGNKPNFWRLDQETSYPASKWQVGLQWAPCVVPCVECTNGWVSVRLVRRRRPLYTSPVSALMPNLHALDFALHVLHLRKEPSTSKIIKVQDTSSCSTCQHFLDSNVAKWLISRFG